MRRKSEIWQMIRRRRSMKKHLHGHHIRIVESPTKVLKEPRAFKRHRLIHFKDDIFPIGRGNKRLQILRSNLMPRNLKYVLNDSMSPFYYEEIEKYHCPKDGIVEIPKNFSIIENPNKSFNVLRIMLSAIFIQGIREVSLNYKSCEHVDLTTQVLLDSLILDYTDFSKRYSKVRRLHKINFCETLKGINIENEKVRKMLFSVGTPKVLNISSVQYEDVTPYYLCRHDALKDNKKQSEQKDLDTTDLVDYVINCLAKVNQQLNQKKIEALCTVIGEALINAEEHSSLKYRYSIGYFQDELVEGKHTGIFRLVIMNFGKTIYEKFKDDNCPNPDIVGKMMTLSKKYTERRLFMPRFTEESLWTLYALQQGVSSTSPRISKRGNGFINFIESFFMLKGSSSVDDVSRTTITSGNTRVIFDGHYKIAEIKTEKKETFKTMTFNKSGLIEDAPDNNFVYHDTNYFPGTIISAKIMLNEDDVTYIK